MGANEMTMKKWFKQPRPANSTLWGYGMPSDHSQFMCTFATFCICVIFARGSKLTQTARLLLVTLLVCWVLAVQYSRSSRGPLLVSLDGFVARPVFAGQFGSVGGTVCCDEWWRRWSWREQAEVIGDVTQRHGCRWRCERLRDQSDDEVSGELLKRK